MMTEPPPACRWCERPITLRRGGTAKVFCSALHRAAYHRATRQWCEREVAAGRLSVEAIRDGAAAAYTLVGSDEPPSPSPEEDIGTADPALLNALRIRGPMMLRLPISSEGIAELVYLGWLHRHDCRNSGSVADALVELANAALALRLRPA